MISNYVMENWKLKGYRKHGITCETLNKALDGGRMIILAINGGVGQNNDMNTLDGVATVTVLSLRNGKGTPMEPWNERTWNKADLEFMYACTCLLPRTIRVYTITSSSK